MTASSSPHRVVLDHPNVDAGHTPYTLDGKSLRASTTLCHLTVGLPPVQGPAAELFLAAIAAWIADRSIPRGQQPDKWTRHIDIAFPVADPTTWPTEQVQRLLRFLSNDRWTVTTYPTTRQTLLSPSQMWIDTLEADSVDLFSGGLDSFAYAASNGHPTGLAVAHWDMPTLKGLQDRLHRDLGLVPDRLRSFHVAVTDSAEESSRTRGFMFATAAIAVAAALNVPRVSIPENGFVALNVPLTPARTGALSTRSTHPHTITLLTETLDALGLDIRLDNPWFYKSKGDITQAAVGSPKGLAQTVSCSRPTVDRWRGNNSYNNCGYCYPCLVRRSGIEAANNGEDPTVYKYDPRTDPAVTAKTSDRRADLYAVVARLAKPPHPRDLALTGPIPPHLERARLQNMRERSHAELSTMLKNGMTQQVRRQLGL